MPVITSHRPVEAVVAMWKLVLQSGRSQSNFLHDVLNLQTQLSRLSLHRPDWTSTFCYRGRLHCGQGQVRGIFSRNLPVGRPDLGGDTAFESLHALCGTIGCLEASLSCSREKEGEKLLEFHQLFFLPSDVDSCVVAPCSRSLKDGQPLF